MKKTALIFPGQGSQYIGMGKDFYNENTKAREIYEIASEQVGIDLKTLCFDENEKLNITEYTQIAMLTTEMAMSTVVKEKGIQIDALGGLSLGEYGAVVESGAMSFKDASYIVRKRGIFMQDEVPVGKGAMAAVIGMDATSIKEIISDSKGVVEIANYNCPGQIVISGEYESVMEASVVLKDKGARRVIPLNVSGPFHSSLLKGAGDKLKSELDKITLSDINIPYVSNVTGDFVSDKNDIKDLLVRQVSTSVRWQQCFETMVASGINTFIEIGPGKTLSSFAKKINKEVTVVNIEKYEDLLKIDSL